MAVEYKIRKLKDLYEKIDQKEIVLPNFQRGFVWTIDEQKKLLASTIVRVPIGSTLHLKGKDDAFSARALCERSSIKPTVAECEYVLDGQQRLSTLKNAFYDIYSGSKWSNTWDNLFSKLRVRWYFFLDKDNDSFGLEDLNFNADYINEMEPRSFLDSISYKKIMKKDIDKWFHPGYSPRDNENNIIIGNNEKKLHIAEKALSENLIPLYEVYLGNDGIHNKVIEMLGLKQIDLLKAKAKDKKAEGNDQYNIFIKESLSSVESNISDIIDELDDQAIDDLFDELGKKWIQKFSAFMERLIEIDMPINLLEQKEAGRAAAIFEEMNNGGTALSIYDLIVAKAANADSSQKSLTDRIIELLDNSYNIPEQEKDWNPTCMTSVKDNMLTPKFQSMYLNALPLLIAKDKKEKIEKTIISRNYVLNLLPKDINSYNKKAIETLIRTYSFLQFRCGVINEKNIIYDYMILPIIYFLEDDKIWNNQKKLNIIEAWYWSWLFSGKYKERQDDQFVKDIEYLNTILIDNSPIVNDDFLSDRIFDAPDYSDKITLLNKNEATDNTAPMSMKDAILQYVLSRKPHDFLSDKVKQITAYKSSCNNTKKTDKNCKEFKLQSHHIIPLGVATAIGETTEEIRSNKKHPLNSPLNFTYISECANSAINDDDYNKYKKELGKKIATHLLQLKNIDSIEKVQECLGSRFDQIKTTLIAEVTELID